MMASYPKENSLSSTLTECGLRLTIKSLSTFHGLKRLEPLPPKPHGHFRNIIGRRCGILTAAMVVGLLPAEGYVWAFRCDCGETKIMSYKRFGHEDAKSCGCATSGWKSENGKKRKTHGMSRHPAFHVWRSMNDRCDLPTHHAYHNYGGRGIAVCESWQRGFVAFWADMGPTYQTGLTLDRRDNNRGYEKENCHWTTRVAQARNTRNNVHVKTKNGQVTGAEAADTASINRTTVYYRIAHGWPQDRLLDPPNHANRIV